MGNTEAAKTVQGGAVREKFKLNLQPASAFLRGSYPKPNWIWDKQMALGCMTLLIGQPKAGKSLFVRNLLRSIAKGDDLLGFQTKLSAVAYFALEDHPSFLHEAMSKADMDCDHIHIDYGSMSQARDIDEMLAAIGEYCETYNIKLVVIDPLTKFLKIGDSNSYTEVYEVLTPIHNFARKHNIHVMLVHHTNKSNSDSPNKIMGSNGFFGCSDGAFFLSRDKKNGIGCLNSDLRYGNSLDDHQFGYDNNGLIVYKGLASTNKVDDLALKIVDFLSTQGGQTVDSIKNHCQCRAETVTHTLDTLMSKKSVIRQGAGNRSSKYVYSIPKIESLDAESDLIESNPVPPPDFVNSEWNNSV